MHSVLHPASAQAHLVTSLWWWMFGVATVVYLIVLLAMFGGAARAPTARDDQRAVRVVGAAAVVTICVSGSFLIYYIRVGSAVDQHVAQPMVIEVVGHQWWWEVIYTDSDTHHRVTTANEMHIPAGQQVAVELRSNDVIHSFWVPSLAGKRDLIPGHPTRAWIQADTPGVYRGQCSQFCGSQHAHMAFLVIAQPRADFDAWLRGQAVAARVPADSTGARGRSLFVSARCASCHTIDGTSDIGSFGPNLTHVGSRSTIAAGTLTNSRDHLAAWILHPESFKPGTTMPANPLNRADLQTLTAYLESLK